MPLSPLLKKRPFLEGPSLIVALRLGRSAQLAEVENDRELETPGKSLEQFYWPKHEPLQLEEDSSPTQQSDATQLTVLLEKIQQVSERLFPGPVSFEHTFDPEEPTCEYTVFDVTAKGSFSDYRDLIFQWHDEVERIVPRGTGDFRLIVHPRR